MKRASCAVSVSLRGMRKLTGVLIGLVLLAIACKEQLPAGHLDREPWIVVDVTHSSIQLGRNGEYRQIELCGIELAPGATDQVRSLLEERNNLVRANFVSNKLAEVWIEYEEDWELLNGLIAYKQLGTTRDDGCPNQVGIDAAGRFHQNVEE